MVMLWKLKGYVLAEIDVLVHPKPTRLEGRMLKEVWAAWQTYHCVSQPVTIG